MIADPLTLFAGKVTLVLIAGFALDALLRRRSALACAGLWNGVLLVLALLPFANELAPRWRWPLSAIGHGVEVAVESAPNAERPKTAISPLVIAPIDVRESSSHAIEPDVPLQAVAKAPAVSNINTIAWRPTIVGIYFLGVLVMLARLALAAVAEQSLRRRARPIESAPWIDGWQRCQRALARPISVRLLLSDRVAIPCALGIRDRAIVIPARLATTTERSTIDAVVLHELAHIARRDLAWLLLQRLIEAFLWVHPLVWLASRRISFVRDRACDEFVVHALGDARAYARTLVDLSAHAGACKPLVCGLAVVRSSNLSRRVDALLDSRGDPRLRVAGTKWWPLAGAGFLGMIALAGLELIGADAAAQPAGQSKLPMANESLDAGVAASKEEVEKLLQQLGSSNFKDRQAAEKALQSMGARAANPVTAWFGNADLETTRRRFAVWRQLWKTELARPPADRLKGFDHPIWARFRKTVGDDAASRDLFIDMVAEFRQFNLLILAEFDPAAASEVYNAELKQLFERAKEAWAEADRAAGGRSGVIWPIPGIPDRGEHATLLFLGTYPATGADSARDNNVRNQFLYRSVFGRPLAARSDIRERADIPPPVRRLFAAWLNARSDPNLIAVGMQFAVFYKIAEVASAARANAAKAYLDPVARGLSVLAVGELGSRADVPLLKEIFADKRVFYPTEGPADRRNLFETQVADAAIAAALCLSEKHPGEFGFPQLAGQSGVFSLAGFDVLGFGDDRTRQAAHKKAQDWLAQQPKAANVAPGNKVDADLLSEEPAEQALQGAKLRRRKITLTGRAVDGAGRPVGGASIYVASQLGEVIGKTTSGDDGRYEIRDAPLPYMVILSDVPSVAEFQVFGTAPKYAFAWGPMKMLRVDLKRAPDAQTYVPGDPIAIDLTFQAPRKIEGIVANEKGEPLVGVKVLLNCCEYADATGEPFTSRVRGFNLTPHLRPKEIPGEVVTDAQGRFEFGSIPSEAICEIRMSHPGHADLRLYATTAANAPKTIHKQPVAPLPLQVTLPSPRSVVVEVRSTSSNEPLVGYNVSAYQEASASQHFADAGTRGDGRATLKLPPGEYRLRIYPMFGPPNLATTTKFIVKGEPNTQIVPYRQPEGCVLILRAVDAVSGEALPNVGFLYEEDAGKKNMMTLTSQKPGISAMQFSFMTDDQGEMHARVPAGKRLFRAIQRSGNGADSDNMGRPPLDRVLELQDGQTVTATFAFPRPQMAPATPK